MSTQRMRRVLLLASLAMGTLMLMAKGPRACDMTALADFHVHYDRFIRDHWGCSAAATRVSECAGEGAGFFNAREFRESRELAKKLYGLREE